MSTIEPGTHKPTRACIVCCYRCNRVSVVAIGGKTKYSVGIRNAGWRDIDHKWVCDKCLSKKQPNG